MHSMTFAAASSRRQLGIVDELLIRCIGKGGRCKQARIALLFADANLTETEVTWALYQDIVAAYRAEDRSEGKRLLQAVIDALSAGLGWLS
ncbi:hypothetical protein BANT10_00374 [Brevibacterium antiquum]|uniref:Uncharacterized protein n=2 Tax=Brevibacterium antiquum TaxID=234835 RepID=A0A2H1HRU8_9MICO|nr:hypothetical protein BANT918_00378 [Brevibacterium antiquum CNRZ 918]SMX66295.1 hypothetical protein BANT10_00374 [Brevibacterium antiquum]